MDQCGSDKRSGSALIHSALHRQPTFQPAILNAAERYQTGLGGFRLCDESVVRRGTIHSETYLP
jgi:hypothetical protein